MNRIISRGSLLAFTMLFAVPVYSSYFDSSHSNQAIKNKILLPHTRIVMNNLAKLGVEFDPIYKRSDYLKRIKAISKSPTQELYRNISDRREAAFKKFEKIQEKEKNQINEETKIKLQTNKEVLRCLIETNIAKSDSNTEIEYWDGVNTSMCCIESILDIKPVKGIMKDADEPLVMKVQTINYNKSSSAASSGVSDKSEA